VTGWNVCTPLQQCNALADEGKIKGKVIPVQAVEALRVARG
jgi:hypothetical protein